VDALGLVSGLLRQATQVGLQGLDLGCELIYLRLQLQNPLDAG
jgi:hypothetical protein